MRFKRHCQRQPQRPASAHLQGMRQLQCALLQLLRHVFDGRLHAQNDGMSTPLADGTGAPLHWSWLSVAAVSAETQTFIHAIRDCWSCAVHACAGTPGWPPARPCWGAAPGRAALPSGPRSALPERAGAQAARRRPHPNPRQAASCPFLLAAPVGSIFNMWRPLCLLVWLGKQPQRARQDSCLLLGQRGCALLQLLLQHEQDRTHLRFALKLARMDSASSKGQRLSSTGTRGAKARTCATSRSDSTGAEVVCTIS